MAIARPLVSIETVEKLKLPNNEPIDRMTETSPLQVTAAIIRRPGEILIARRPADAHLEGHWEFPGGKIEPGESPEECLARELHEEFGVEASVGEFVASSRFAYEDREIELLAYEAELSPGEWTLNSHDQARWVALEDLLAYRLAPADVPIAEVVVRGRSGG